MADAQFALTFQRMTDYALYNKDECVHSRVKRPLPYKGLILTLVIT